MTSTVLANSTVESRMPSQLSDAALGGIIGGAIAGLVLFLTVTIAAVYCVHRRKRLKLESPEGSVDPFTYVRQINHRDGSWTLPPGSTVLFDSPTLPTSNSFCPGHVDTNTATTDRLILPEVIAEAEVVVEKQTQIRNCFTTPETEKSESEPASETGLRVVLENKIVTGTGCVDETEPKGVSGTGLRDDLEPEVVVETGLRDRQSVNSLNLSFSEDYCNRVIDEAFLAIDNFAYSDNQSDTD